METYQANFAETMIVLMDFSTLEYLCNKKLCLQTLSSTCTSACMEPQASELCVQLFFIPVIQIECNKNEYLIRLNL